MMVMMAMTTPVSATTDITFHPSKPGKTSAPAYRWKAIFVMTQIASISPEKNERAVRL